MKTSVFMSSCRFVLRPLSNRDEVTKDEMTEAGSTAGRLTKDEGLRTADR